MTQFNYILKTAAFLFFIIIVQCNRRNENCVWNYRCCEFKEINNVVKCEKMCEAIINCNQTYSNEIENFNKSSPIDETSQYSFRRRMCRSGFKYVNGQCRKVF